jgi:hypothetical protein
MSKTVLSKQSHGTTAVSFAPIVNVARIRIAMMGKQQMLGHQWEVAGKLGWNVIKV